MAKKKLYAYCFSCQDSREVNNGEVILLRNGKRLLEGKCSKCKSSVASIMKKSVRHDKVQTKKEEKERRGVTASRRTKRIADLRLKYNAKRN